MMARRSARECYPVLQRIPVFNPAISEMRVKSANTAIHLIRLRSISLPLGARWIHSLRPCDGQRWADKESDRAYGKCLPLFSE